MKLKHLFVILAIGGFPVTVAAHSTSPHTVNVTFTVNSVADSVDANPGDGLCQDLSGQCSLRAAIMEANALAGPDTIVFDPITDGQPQLLQLHGAGEDGGATGDLDITEGLTITGNGTDKTIIDGDAADRVFDIHPASGTIIVQIDDLAAQNGAGVINGGGIQVHNATLTLNGDLLEQNQATNISGGAYGGAIYADGASLTLDHTTLDGNAVSASNRAAGGGIGASNASVVQVLDGSTIANNVAEAGPSNDAQGGGIYSAAGSTLTVDSSAVRGNEANNANANEAAYGGGIEASGGTYLVINSEISNNTAQSTTFAFGGGMDAEFPGADSALVDTTVSGNKAIANPGSAFGGGLSLGSNVTSITEALDNVTVANNSVSSNSGGGGGVSVYNNADTVLLSNTLVANNQDSSANAPDCLGANGGILTSGGYNLIGDGTGCNFANATGDQIGSGTAPIDPLLDTLADNGGKTQTLALLAGSPAVDAGNPAGCTDASGSPLTRDQRNYPRPEDGNASGTAVCDIGAYERAADTPPSASDSSLTVTKNTAANGTLSANDSDGDALVFAIASQPAHGTLTLKNSVTGAFTYTPDQGYTGSDSFTFNANDGFVDSNTATESITVKAAANSGGGGGSSAPLVLLGLLLLALVPWWLRRRDINSDSNQSPGGLRMKPGLPMAACAALMLGLFTSPALAAPGDIDTTFNGGIPAVLDLNPTGEVRAYNAAVNPINGDILWSGYVLTPVNEGGAITAYKPDGTLDTAVGGGSGEIELTADQAGMSGGSLDFYAIAVDGQGRILAAGIVSSSSGYAMVLARFKPDGTLDTGFGAGGTGVLTDGLNTAALGTGLSLTADGQILVTGSAADPAITEAQLTVWRFNPDGTADTGFGDHGHIQVPGIANIGLVVCFPALQNDGALIAGCSFSSDGSWKITRLNPDASVDTGFGSSGFVTGGAGLRLEGLALAPDGGFVVSELDQSFSPPPIGLRRYLSDGSVDSGFNGGSPLDFGTLPGPSAMLPLAVQPDGKILASGNGGSNSLVVARLLADGTLDSGFGNASAGISAIDFNSISGNNYTPGATALVMQGDGKIVASGYADSSAGSSYAAFVTRLDNDTFSFTPDAFSFMDKTGVSLSTLITSNAISVSGLSSNISVPVSVSGGEYKVNSGAWTSGPGLVQNGDQVAVRHTSSGSYSTQTTTTLTIGGQAIPNNDSTVLGNAASSTFTSTTKAKASGGGGGGGFGLLALLGLGLLFVPRMLRRRT